MQRRADAGSSLGTQRCRTLTVGALEREKAESVSDLELDKETWKDAGSKHTAVRVHHRVGGEQRQGWLGASHCGLL